MGKERDGVKLKKNISLVNQREEQIYFSKMVRRETIISTKWGAPIPKIMYSVMAKYQ